MALSVPSLSLSSSVAKWLVGSARALTLALTASAAAGALALIPADARAQGTIKIGELNSYKILPNTAEPYRRGWQLAMEEINAAGGVLGRKIETIHRDDNGNPGDAVRAAEELISREQVALLAGVTLSHVGVALTDFARQRKVLFVASGPLSDRVVWQSGNRYTYRLRAGTYSLATAVLPEAVKLKKKRWALVYPNYEYGQAAAAAFKENLKKQQPDVEFVAEIAPPFNKIDAGAVVQALADAKPDAIFNVLFGTDLAKFAREGKTRGLFNGREVFSLLTGEPEYLDPLKDDAPEGWFATGYPYYSITSAEHKRFADAYQAKYKDYPRLNSVIGYATMKSIAAGIAKAGSTDTERMVAAFKGLEFDTPFGRTMYRPQDNQGTLGIYVGRLGVKDGRGLMTSQTFMPGAQLMPPDAEVAKLRPAE
jgi:branched-chain amino acid transport system substrate-binding protein